PHFRHRVRGTARNSSPIEPCAGQYSESQVQLSRRFFEFSCGRKRRQEWSCSSLATGGDSAFLVRSRLGIERHRWSVAASFPAVRIHHDELLPGESRPIYLQRAADQGGAAFPQWTEPAGLVHLFEDDHGRGLVILDPDWLQLPGFWCSESL